MEQLEESQGALVYEIPSLCIREFAPYWGTYNQVNFKDLPPDCKRKLTYLADCASFYTLTHGIFCPNVPFAVVAIFATSTYEFPIIYSRLIIRSDAILQELNIDPKVKQSLLNSIRRLNGRVTLIN